MDVHLPGLVDDLTVDVLGTTVRLRAPVGVLAELRDALVDLPPGREPSRLVEVEEADGGLVLIDGGQTVREAIDPVVGAATVVWHLNAIATQAAGHLLVHAACVAADPGGAVLIPGRSGAGKSTLAAACVRQGLGYLTDELAALDLRQGTVTPYPKPIGLDAERLVPGSTLGTVVASATPLSAIVFPRYEAGTEHREVPLDLGWTLLALAAHTPNLLALGGPGLAWLAGLALACPATQITHGDAGLAVPTIQTAARRPPVRITPAPTLPPVTPGTTAVALEDQLAVLHHGSGRVNLLNRTSAAVWRRAADAVDRAHAVEAVLRADDLEGLDRATAMATVDQLVDAGLLDAIQA